MYKKIYRQCMTQYNENCTLPELVIEAETFYEFITFLWKAIPNYYLPIEQY